jgi:hypothetical protein
MRGVFLHGYRPTVKGVAVTFAQFAVVMLLPQGTSMALYKAVKDVTLPSLFSFSPTYLFNLLLSKYEIIR